MIQNGKGGNHINRDLDLRFVTDDIDEVMNLHIGSYLRNHILHKNVNIPGF